MSGGEGVFVGAGWLEGVGAALICLGMDDGWWSEFSEFSEFSEYSEYSEYSEFSEGLGWWGWGNDLS